MDSVDWFQPVFLSILFVSMLVAVVAAHWDTHVVSFWTLVETAAALAAESSFRHHFSYFTHFVRRNDMVFPPSIEDGSNNFLVLNPLVRFF